MGAHCIVLFRSRGWREAARAARNPEIRLHVLDRRCSSRRTRNGARATPVRCSAHDRTLAPVVKARSNPTSNSKIRPCPLFSFIARVSIISGRVHVALLSSRMDEVWQKLCRNARVALFSRAMAVDRHRVPQGECLSSARKGASLICEGN